jgi:hypothetical protein
MQETETVLSAIRGHPKNGHWRARYGETRSAGSGRGRRKRTRIAGTSPAAYFTREGGMEKRTGSNPGTALHADPTTMSR